MQENAIVKASISKQIAEQLRAAIVDGRFKIGERLPTEDELAQLTECRVQAFVRR